jgi:formylglycine-generating enzyme required for sulfatase activity
MVLVDGAYCPFVAHRCKKERKSRSREEAVCELYDNAVLCEGALDPLRYCIDRYEYPNRVGALPATLVSFEEAERACATEDKRLCTLREWTFACEGEAVLPYPVGLERKAAVCNWDAGPDAHVTPTRGPHVAATLAKADRRMAAGERTTCASPFGVVDLGGNVAEWVVEPTQSKKRDPFASVIAGGGWGSGPGACRTHDDAHPPPHRAAMVGFRCCADAWNDGSLPRMPRMSRKRPAGFAPILPPAGLP